MGMIVSRPEVKLMLKALEHGNLTPKQRGKLIAFKNQMRRYLGLVQLNRRRGEGNVAD